MFRVRPPDERGNVMTNAHDHTLPIKQGVFADGSSTPAPKTFNKASLQGSPPLFSCLGVTPLLECI
jgi:hypothetical protein